MNYKLAKRLKEVGYPVHDIWDKDLYLDWTKEITDEKEWEKIFEDSWNKVKDRCSPKLSELIEATKQKGRTLSLDECQEIISEMTDKKTGRLLKDESGRFIRGVISPYHWEAKIEDWGREYGGRSCGEPGDEVVACEKGKTPLEAVAKLYIKLNKK